MGRNNVPSLACRNSEFMEKTGREEKLQPKGIHIAPEKQHKRGRRNPRKLPSRGDPPEA